MSDQDNRNSLVQDSKIEPPAELIIESESLVDRSDRVRERVLFFSTLAIFCLGSFELATFSLTTYWQTLAISASTLFSFLAVRLSVRWLRSGKLTRSGNMLALAIVTPFYLSALIVPTASIYILALGIVVVLTAGYAFQPPTWAPWLFALGVLVFEVWSASQFIPMSLGEGTGSKLFVLYVLAPILLFAAIILGYVALFYLRTMSVKMRLSVTIVLIVLVSVIAITYFSGIASLGIDQSQAFDQLERVAQSKHAQIDAWINNLPNRLEIVITDSQLAAYTKALLNSPGEIGRQTQPVSKEETASLRGALQLLKKSYSFDEISLIDITGRIILSTELSLENQIANVDQYVGLGQDSGIVLNSDSRIPSERAIVAIQKIVNAKSELVGFLIGRTNLNMLNTIMAERPTYSKSAETYLVGLDQIKLTRSPANKTSSPPEAHGQVIKTQGVTAALASKQNGSGIYNNDRGISVIGVYHWIPALQAVLVTEEDESDAYASTWAILKISFEVTLIVLLIASIGAMWRVQEITAPLDHLTKVAVQITAGNLGWVVPVIRKDEFGTLATAFNSMTARLRELIVSLQQHVERIQQAQSELESRVQERTQELAQINAELWREIAERKKIEQQLRLESIALQAARQTAEILRAANVAFTQSLDLDVVINALLDYAKQVVSYDRASILLLETESHLVVRAQRGYEPWGNPTAIRENIFDTDDQTINTILRDRKTIAIADTWSYPGWEQRAGFEHARSWLGIPLVAGGNVIGLFTLEKAEPNYFTPEHIRLIGALAGQATVAVQNAWLFQQIRAGRERLQTLSRRLVEVQENERRYIARELHDETGQTLTSLRVGLHMLEREAHQPQAIIDGVAELKNIVSHLFDDLHRLAMNLLPASLDHLGLVAALRQYIEALCAKSELVIQFETAGLEDKRLPPDIETALYRIVQESLTNVIRHARASRVDVLIKQKDGKIIAMVEDNGVGFDLATAAQSGRLGLFNMQERAEMLGGTLVIETSPHSATTILAEIPYVNSNINC